ncbi:MAG: hypothetical protein U0X93_06650 [Anaerolineales bacterium]
MADGNQIIFDPSIQQILADTFVQETLQHKNPSIYRYPIWQPNQAKGQVIVRSLHQAKAS